ncbi:hypothetical protein [Clostridium rectalis]|nr:hypothetical protein [Clostridium rectalis]
MIGYRRKNLLKSIKLVEEFYNIASRDEGRNSRILKGILNKLSSK